MTALSVGAARRDITPGFPVALAGFASRRGLSERVAQPLHVRVAVFETTGATERVRAVVVSADILQWTSELVPALRDDLAALADTEPDHVLLSATHTHSAPATAEPGPHTTRAADPRFLTLLREQTMAAVSAALGDLEPVTVHRKTAPFPLGMYRRCLVDGVIRLGLNPEGPIDHELTVATFRRADASPKTILVHYACHPVISMLQEVSGEYPGVAMSEIEAQSGAVSLFLQGCCGDIDPDFTGTALVRRGDDKEIVQTGQTLARVVLESLGTPEEELRPRQLAARELSVELPYRHIPDRRELQAGSNGPGEDAERCCVLLAHPELLRPSETLTIQRLDLADGLALLAMNGEIVIRYGLHVRAQSGGRVLPMGYSNGMIGYVPTALQIAEGGYEAEEAALRDLKPSGFAPEIEGLVTGALDRLTDASS